MSALDPVPADQIWTLTRDFAHPVASVFHALTDADAITRWYGPAGWSVVPDSVDVDPSEGGNRSLRLALDEDPSQEAPVHARHQEVVPGRLLEIHEFLPDHEGRPSEHVIVLRCELRPMAVESPDGGRYATRVTLTQGPLPEQVHDHARAAWASSLERLAGFLRDQS